VKVGGTPSYVGWAVAVNSLGTFLASPIFGWLADRLIGFRWVFFFSFVLMFGGSLWYSLSTEIYELLAARFIVGIAAANYAPACAYISY
jgi:MFS family permease